MLLFVCLTATVLQDQRSRRGYALYRVSLKLGVWGSADPKKVKMDLKNKVYQFPCRTNKWCIDLDILVLVDDFDKIRARRYPLRE